MLLFIDRYFEGFCCKRGSALRGTQTQTQTQTHCATVVRRIEGPAGQTIRKKEGVTTGGHLSSLFSR